MNVAFGTLNHVQEWKSEGKIIIAKIPSSIINNADLGEKRALFYLSLYFSIQRSGEIIVMPNEQIQSIGYKPNPHKGRINDEFNGFLSMMEKENYIQLISKFKLYSKYRSLQRMDNSIPFASIRYNELQEIISNDSNKAAVSLLLAYLRLNIYKRQTNDGNDHEIYFCHLNDLADAVGIRHRIISSYISVLDDLNIIHGEELPRYQDNFGNWHSGLYMFVNKNKYIGDATDRQYDWKVELSAGMDWISNEQMRYIQ